MLNKVMLIGHLGKDPDVRTLDSGTKVCQFTLATTEKGYTLQNGTQVPDRTEWHNLVLWKGLAEVAGKYLHITWRFFPQHLRVVHRIMFLKLHYHQRLQVMIYRSDYGSYYN